MTRATGQRIGLSLPRLWIADLMHASRGMPYVIIDRPMHLGRVAAARKSCSVPISWPTLFTKAYALVAQDTPELRRSFQRYPRTHLFEADHSVASVAVSREYAGEPAVFFGLLVAPERQSLSQITRILEEYKSQPIESIRPFARLIRYTRYPAWVRRRIWWLGLNLSGRHRAKTVGTFALTTLASKESGLVQILSPCTTTLTYGPIDDAGDVQVRLSVDLRVLDGRIAAQALEDVERTMNNEMVAELQAITS